jgi:hypothetical protein
VRKSQGVALGLLMGPILFFGGCGLLNSLFFK